MKALHAGSIETAGRSALKVAFSTALAADALRKTAAATVYRAGFPNPVRSGTFSELQIDHFVMAITSAEAIARHTLCCPWPPGVIQITWPSRVQD
jgi:hypothetical protein